MPEKTLLDALTPGNMITLGIIAVTTLGSWFSLKGKASRNQEDIEALKERMTNVEASQQSLEVAQAAIKERLTSMQSLLERIYNKLDK